MQDLNGLSTLDEATAIRAVLAAGSPGSLRNPIAAAHEDLHNKRERKDSVAVIIGWQRMTCVCSAVPGPPVLADRSLRQAQTQGHCGFPRLRPKAKEGPEARANRDRAQDDGDRDDARRVRRTKMTKTE